VALLWGEDGFRLDDAKAPNIPVVSVAFWSRLLAVSPAMLWGASLCFGRDKHSNHTS